MTVLTLITSLLIACGNSDEGPMPPSNLMIDVQVSNDKSGKVTFTASADNATNYVFFFGENLTALGVESSSGQVEHTYTKSGTYNARILAYSTEDLFISETVEVVVETNIAEGTYLLVWADEFDTPGAPDDSKWTYDIGTGQDGWGNQELQYYTDRSENVIVEDGMLKIIAKREDFEDSEFTSTRLKTQGLYDFTYGKVEIRAKLPAGGGTWPAFWLLGSDIEQVGWPACGEIDIMEQTGDDKTKVSAALHTPASFGATVNFRETELETAADEFHIYGMEWTNEIITFSVDGNDFYNFSPSPKTAETWPFSKPFFLIFNIAMGGTLGGTVPANFTESTMEVDYVRVYQQ